MKFSTSSTAQNLKDLGKKFGDDLSRYWGISEETLKLIRFNYEKYMKNFWENFEKYWIHYKKKKDTPKVSGKIE